MKRFGRYKPEDAQKGSVVNVLKMVRNEGKTLTDAILTQAGKFPKSMRQWWADFLLLNCTTAIINNEWIFTPLNKRKKRRKRNGKRNRKNH